MKNLKTSILIVFIAICCVTNVNARGKSKGKVVMTGRPGSIVVFGGGTSMPSSDGKDKAFLSNSKAINADVFLQLKRWTPVLPKPHISIGLNIGGIYNFGGSGGFGVTPNSFAVTGQTSSMVADKGTDPAQAGFRMGAGPQVNFQFGKLIISPMVLGEYFSMTQNERSFVQTTQYNGQSYDFSLASMPQTKTSGLAVTPKLRLHYMFNGSFGLFADASYTTGPKIETTISKLVPNGNPQTPGDTYNLQQLQTGTMVKGETKSTAYSATGFHFGVVIGLGRNKHETSKNTVLNVRKTAGGASIDVTPAAQKIKTKSNSTNERTAGNTDDIRKGWNGKTVTENEVKFPAQIQKLIDEQDAKMNTTFQKVKNNNMKVNSLCNFSVEKVEIECNGKDNQGNKKYKIKITYKNLSSSGVGSLGHYLTACSATTSNGNYIEAMPLPTSATITGLSPGIVPKTIIGSGASQLISFDFVPTPSFVSLNIMGNIINSATSCGNCDDVISLNLPNCCDGCEENPVTAVNNSIASIDDNNGTIKVQNTVSSPNNIVKIEADLVSVKIIPNNSDCQKCNDKIKKQDNFVDKNQITNNTGWDNSGNPSNIGGENSDPTVSRSLTYTTTSPTGINLSSGAQFNHTIGIAPTSCCGDTVEIWIRYTVWDKDCHVCDKLVKSSIKRDPACAGNNNGTSGSQNPSKL